MKTTIIKLKVLVDLYRPVVDVLSSKKSKKKKQKGKSNEVIVPEVIMPDSYMEKLQVKPPEFLTNIGNNLINRIQSVGFKPMFGSIPYISQDNGGYALYVVFQKIFVESIVKIILDVRLADHPSRPNLEKRNIKRLEILSREYEEVREGVAKPALLDVYCKDLNWGVQIFVGGNFDKDYSGPVSYNNKLDSFESMDRVVEGKLNKIIDVYTQEGEYDKSDD